MLRLGPKKGYAALKRHWLVLQMQTRREGWRRRVWRSFGLQRWMVEMWGGAVVAREWMRGQAAEVWW